MRAKYALWICIALIIIAAGLFIFKSPALLGDPDHSAMLGKEDLPYNPGEWDAAISQNDSPKQRRDMTHELLEQWRGRPIGEAASSGQNTRKGTPAEWKSKALSLLEQWRKHQFRKDMDPGSEFDVRELIEALHGAPIGAEELFRKIWEIMNDSSVPVSAKRELIFILSRAATPETVRILAEILSGENISDELKHELISQISMIGGYFWERQDVYQATAPVLKLWQETEDPELLNALATAMGHIANSESLNYLFDAVLNQATTLEEIWYSGDSRAQAALTGFERVRNSEAAPIIGSRLMDSTNRLEIAICTDILASMEDAGGARYLLSWMQNTDDSFAPFIPGIMQRISSLGLEYLDTVHLQNLNFRSHQVEQAVISFLDSRQ
ncbi:MAG: hypothetical protein JXA82_06125 [Sedimentisphaerales bacterium]|nr:hypothetical protein [Sedimentisphaerales bacterium]